MQSLQGSMASDSNYSIDEIMEIVSRDKEYYVSTNGGVTLSGGEPLMQDPDSLIDLLKLLKKDKIKITVETSLHAPWNNINKILPYIDLFFVDLKVVGNDDLHMKYTKQNSTLIHDNIKKLLELNANIKFRMVMVPGYTDSESNIQATSNFLKSINYDSIELLKYHDLWEEKVQRLGLEVDLLNIIPVKSLESLKKGVELFKKHGIKAENSDLDSSKVKAKFTPRVKAIQKAIRTSPRHFCMETAKLKTEFYKKHGFNKPPHIHRAESLEYLLQNKTVKVYPKELLVGNFTAHRVACQLWIEYYGIIAAKVIYKLKRLKPITFQASSDDLVPFIKILSFWLTKGVLGRAYPDLNDVMLLMARTAEMNAGFNNNMAAICHFVANFERILKLGTSGIIEEIRAKREEKPENNQDFYKGAIIALKSLEAFAQRYADHLSDLSQKVKDSERRQALY
jgi:pyruvate-formate lyase-activating enzyme